MKTKTTLLLVTLLFAIAAFGEEQRPKLQSPVRHGAYGYSCSGAHQGQPFAAYGYVHSDGKGQWHGYGKLSLNGTVLPWTHNTRANDPATVNPDCTGT